MQLSFCLVKETVKLEQSTEINTSSTGKTLAEVESTPEASEIAVQGKNPNSGTQFALGHPLSLVPSGSV